MAFCAAQALCLCERGTVSVSLCLQLPSLIGLSSAPMGLSKCPDPASPSSPSPSPPSCVDSSSTRCNVQRSSQGRLGVSSTRAPAVVSADVSSGDNWLRLSANGQSFVPRARAGGGGGVGCEGATRRSPAALSRDSVTSRCLVAPSLPVRLPLPNGTRRLSPLAGLRFQFLVVVVVAICLVLVSLLPLPLLALLRDGLSALAHVYAGSVLYAVLSATVCLQYVYVYACSGLGSGLRLSILFPVLSLRENSQIQEVTYPCFVRTG